ncbi:hypothetical protein NNC19_09345 [Clostridium sp. SHJSY1]|uniref:hypothetical protein n=1 Tax=Clostridium sp. SHJSY1 TaxID=2942483 RepID=UPI00287436DA|nr:hypothetical protein [Clostridium sp. SHJSY1]MDS0525880.1 hypothetical protein [Clostridium sp. SHJSY1]
MKYNLTNCSKEEMINLTKELMNKLPEKERLEFALNWINAKETLMEVGIYDKEAFIKSVEVLCKECIDRQYCIELEHDYYLYEDEEKFEDYSQSEWVCEFKELLETVIMVARSRNFDSSYRVFETLIECLQEVEFNEEIFTIDNPRDYIDIDLY